MTLRPVVFHPGVEDDLASIYEHYEAFASSLPGRFEARLDDQIERIEMFPSREQSCLSFTAASC